MTGGYLDGFPSSTLLPFFLGGGGEGGGGLLTKAEC